MDEQTTKKRVKHSYTDPEYYQQDSGLSRWEGTTIIIPDEKPEQEKRNDGNLRQRRK